MSKHTPGPWRIGALESGQAAVDGVGGDVTGWVSIPDAHLIAAAPDLWDALETLERLSGSSMATDDPARVAARAVLKRARGES
jgi:hypothetical protein